ncbi:MAG: flippase-like domain-containing protein [Proteobacteria bacterium]|nr:flippase-like domain-containing protein [Pseudomonadota bacterium]
MNKKKALMNLLKVAVTVGILYLIFQRFDIGSDDIIKAFQHQPGWFAAAALMQAGAILFSILRWLVLLNGQGLRVPFGHAVRTFMVGRFLGTFTPTGVGLEAYKAWDIARYTGKAEASVSVVLIEKLIGTFFSLGLLVLLTLPYFAAAIDTRALMIFGSFFGVLLVIALILLFQPGLFRLLLRFNFPGKGKIEKPLERIVAAFTVYNQRKGSLLGAVALGFGVYLFWFLTYYMNSLALGANLSLLEVLKVGPLTQIATMLPISIAGVGLREGAFMALLQALGTLAADAPKDVAASVMLTASMVYFVSISLNLIGAVIFLTRRTDYKAQMAQMKAER